VRGFASLKFLDELVLPLVILLAARYFGFFASIYLRPVQFSFGSRSDLVSAPFLNFDWPGHLVFSNSISWFFVACVLAVFFGFILFRNKYFHADWIHPRVVHRLHNKNLEFLITEQKEAFYQASSWCFLTSILLILVITEFLAGQLAVFTFGVAWAISVSLILVFLLQSARDGKLRRKTV